MRLARNPGTEYVDGDDRRGYTLIAPIDADGHLDEDAFRQMREARWDMAAFDSAVRESQARRWVVYEALRNGAYYPWDHQPLQKASERYMRNHMNLDNLEGSKRFPRGE